MADFLKALETRLKDFIGRLSGKPHAVLTISLEPVDPVSLPIAEADLAEHTVDQRLEMMEDTLVELLRLVVHGEKQQREDIRSASLGLGTGMLAAKPEVDYEESLQQLHDQYASYLDQARQARLTTQSLRT